MTTSTAPSSSWSWWSLLGYADEPLIDPLLDRANLSLTSLIDKLNVSIKEQVSRDPSQALSAFRAAASETELALVQLHEHRAKLEAQRKAQLSQVSQVPDVLIDASQFDQSVALAQRHQEVRQLFWTLWVTHPIQDVSLQVSPVLWINSQIQDLPVGLDVLVPVLDSVNHFRAQLAAQAPVVFNRLQFLESSTGSLWLACSVGVSESKK
jgi:hypothetical protein